MCGCLVAARVPTWVVQSLSTSFWIIYLSFLVKRWAQNTLVPGATKFVINCVSCLRVTCGTDRQRTDVPCINRCNLFSITLIPCPFLSRLSLSLMWTSFQCRSDVRTEGIVVICPLTSTSGAPEVNCRGYYGCSQHSTFYASLSLLPSFVLCIP